LPKYVGNTVGKDENKKGKGLDLLPNPLKLFGVPKGIYFALLSTSSLPCCRRERPTNNILFVGNIVGYYIMDKKKGPVQ
jgi:hypothetical protein